MRRALFATALLTATAACGARSELDLLGASRVAEASAPSMEGGVEAAPPHDATTARDGRGGDAGDDAPTPVRDASIDRGPLPTIAPRPIAPLSTSRVTRRRPTLRWTFPSGIGVTDATVDLCLDRGCARPIGAPAHVTGTSYAPGSDLPIGVVFWRLHPSTVTSVTSPTWQFTVGAENAPVDTSWGTTLDVNGDGYADVVVGAGGGAFGESWSAYVYLGSATGLSTTPATTLVSPAGGAGHLYAASAGDLNGDGYADLVLGAPGDATGNVYLYMGSATGLPVNPTITLSGGGAEGTTYGVNPVGGGDVNGDGYADLLVGEDDGESGTSSVDIYGGGPVGIAMPLGTVGVGRAFGENVGIGSFASAGDINGDGYADLVIGVLGTSDTGSANVYLGSPLGFSQQPSSVVEPPSDAYLELGTSVTAAGDVNGDGYADVLIGSYLATDNTASSASLFLGGPTGLAATPVVTLTDPTRFEALGFAWDFVSAIAGDVNGDGYADLVVGAPVNSTAYVYLGGPAGLPTTPTTTMTGPDGISFGQAVASAGDVNGDGFDDAIVCFCSPSNDLGEPDGQGSVAVYAGTAGGLDTTAVTTLNQPADGGAFFGDPLFGSTN